MHQNYAADLETLFEVTNPADLTRNLTVIQTLLIAIAALKRTFALRMFREQKYVRHEISFREISTWCVMVGVT